MRDRFTLFMDAAIAQQKRAEVTPPAAPADCIRQFPTLSPDTIELVGFDSHATPRIRVELPRDENISEWSRWLLKWVRRRERDELKSSMHIV